jgi:hypothetical protein
LVLIFFGTYTSVSTRTGLKKYLRWLAPILQTTLVFSITALFMCMSPKYFVQRGLKSVWLRVLINSTPFEQRSFDSHKPSSVRSV